jgi:dTDP-4-amino-4,6-dideoxygalactose transaminase
MHFPPLHGFTLGKQLFKGQPLALPVVDAVAPRLVSLPMGPHLTDEAIDCVADAVKKALL